VSSEIMFCSSYVLNMKYIYIYIYIYVYTGRDSEREREDKKNA